MNYQNNAHEGFNTRVLPSLNANHNYGFRDQKFLDEAIDRFYSFLDFLEAQGAPKHIVNKAISNVDYFIQMGHEPTVSQLLGLSYPRGLSGLFDNDQGDGLSEGEMEIVDAAFVAAGAEPGFGKAIVSLIPKGLLDSTFGAVFANGFNLSCWNSTFLPSKVTEEVSLIHAPFFTKVLEVVGSSINTQELEDNFNYLLRAVYTSYDMYANKMWNGANWKSCSKEAIQIYIDIVGGAKTQTDILLDKLKGQYNISISTKSVPAQFTYPKEFTGQAEDFSWSESQHGNSTYRVIKFNQRIEDTLKNDSTQQAGFGVVSMLLLAGIGFGIWKNSKNKKSVN
tara:strand:- start:88456 stop:89466 length:1011 start_codon:yes stop_codon:yes gene_type:complete